MLLGIATVFFGVSIYGMQKSKAAYDVVEYGRKDKGVFVNWIARAKKACMVSTMVNKREKIKHGGFVMVCRSVVFLCVASIN